MSDGIEEKNYIEGQNSIWRRLLTEASRELEIEDGKYLRENLEARAKIQGLFDQIGSDQYEPDLHMADLLERLGDELEMLNTPNIAVVHGGREYTLERNGTWLCRWRARPEDSLTQDVRSEEWLKEQGAHFFRMV